MINKRLIKKFLARKLNRYDWVKRLSSDQLNGALDSFVPKPDFGNLKLWNHQKACLLILNELQRFMLYIDMGGGKTLLTLMLLKYRKQCGDKIKAIVFVPYITSVATWIDETEKHTPELKCVPLLGSTAQNLQALNSEGDLFVICYQSAVAMVSKSQTTKKGKSKWNFEAKEIREYFSNFNMLVCDEIHRCKSASSLSYRMCRAISAQCDWVLGLTGTPFGRDLIDLWPQFYLIDFGETLGPTLGFYKEAFFIQKKNYWGGFDFKFDKKLMPTLTRTIKNNSISYSIDEFYDMPPKEYVPKYLPLTDDSKGYVIDAMTKMKFAQKGGDYREVESNYLKLRQLSSGFMTLRGEDDDKIHLSFEDNPKLDALEEIIDAMPHGRKIVIFHHFIHTNYLISERLKKMKVKHARIWSGQRKPLDELRKFQNDPKYTTLVINSKSGSSSLNLQNANYMVFFEQPDSPIDRQQAERRCWRPGQQNRLYIYDFLVKGTADVRLHHANKAGESLLKQLLKGDEL